MMVCIKAAENRERGVAIEIVSINLLLVVEMSTRAIADASAILRIWAAHVCVCGLCLCGAFIELVRYMYDGPMTAEK